MEVASKPNIQNNTEGLIPSASQQQQEQAQQQPAYRATAITDDDTRNDDEQTSSGFSESLDSHDEMAQLDFSDLLPFSENKFKFGIENNFVSFDIDKNHNGKVNATISTNEFIMQSESEKNVGSYEFSQTTSLTHQTVGSAFNGFDYATNADHLLIKETDTIGEHVNHKSSTMDEENDEEFTFSDCMSCSEAVNFNLTFSCESLSTLAPAYTTEDYAAIDNSVEDSNTVIFCGDEQNSLEQLSPQHLSTHAHNLPIPTAAKPSSSLHIPNNDKMFKKGLSFNAKIDVLCNVMGEFIIDADSADYLALNARQLTAQVVYENDDVGCVDRTVKVANHNGEVVVEEEEDDGHLNYSDQQRLITSADRARSCLIDYRSHKRTAHVHRMVTFADEQGFALDSVRYLTPPNDYLSPLLIMESVSDKVESRLLRQSIPRRVLLPLFEQPNSLADFEIKLKKNNIVLEYTFSNCMSIYGSVRVLNISFEKQIFIRYSIDGWKTVRNLKASYSHHHEDSDSDSFSFYHNFSMWLTTLKRVEFAIQFLANGKEFWDNNEGKNYSLTCKYST